MPLSTRRQHASFSVGTAHLSACPRSWGRRTPFQWPFPCSKSLFPSVPDWYMSGWSERSETWNICKWTTASCSNHHRLEENKIYALIRWTVQLLTSDTRWLEPVFFAGRWCIDCKIWSQREHWAPHPLTHESDIFHLSCIFQCIQYIQKVVVMEAPGSPNLSLLCSDLPLPSQLCVLQGWSPFPWPGHGLPPYFGGGLLHFLVLRISPPSHSREHVFPGIVTQSPQWPSTEA